MTHFYTPAGVYLGFYVDGIPTVPHVAGDPPPPPVIPRSLLKTSIYRRATDAELALFKTWKETMATIRQRFLWEDSVEIDPTDPDVIAVMTALFGALRAVELLA